MNQKSIWGIVLIIIGALVLAYQGFTYTTHKKAVDIGSVQIEKTEHHAVYLPPVLGAIALVGGIALLASDRMRR